MNVIDKSLNTTDISAFLHCLGLFEQQVWVQHILLCVYMWLKRMLFIRTKHNMQIFWVIPFIKLQNDTQTMVKW